jgi:ribosome-binding factor A
MVSKQRTERIAERIRNELSEMVIYDISDPRLKGISITDVNVDRELAFASIYVSAFEGSVRTEEIMAGLESARGFLRRELSHRINLRSFPHLRFYWDPTFERAEHIDRLITSLQEEPSTDEERQDSIE